MERIRPRLAAGTVLGIALAMVVGCIVPTPEHGPGRITSQTIESLEPGTTTREDVLLTLGDPKERRSGDRFFVYRWDVVQAYWFVAGGYTAAGGPIPQVHHLCAEFAPDHRLVRVDHIEPWIWEDSQARAAEVIAAWSAEPPKAVGGGREQ